MAALVQSVTGTFGRPSGTTTTVALTLPAPITPGNALVFHFAVNLWLDHQANVAAPAGSWSPATGGGVTWTDQFTPGALDIAATGPAGQALAAPHSLSVIAYGRNSSGGSGPVSIVYTGDYSSISAILSEFSGVSLVLPIEALTNSASPAVSGTVNNEPLPFVTTVNDLVLDYVAWFSLAKPTSIVHIGPNGFTEIARAVSNFSPTTPGLDVALVAGWRTHTTRGTYTSNWEKDLGYSWAGIGLALRLPGPSAALVARDAGTGNDTAMLTAPAHISVPPAIINLPDRHLFGGVDLSTFAVIQRRTSGGDSHPALRGENPAWAGLPGSQSLGQLPASRIYTIELYVHGMNPNGSVGAAEDIQARANLDALQTILAAGVEQPLIRVMPDGSGRQAQAKVWSVQEIDGRIANALFALKVDFYLADPWFYSDAVIDLNRALSSTSVAFTITHPGSVRGHHVLFDLLGPMTDPRITNTTTGTWVQFTGAIANNQRLYIDSEHFSALRGGANVVGSISHGGAVPFVWIAPGPNNFVVTSNPNGGTLTTTFSPPFI